MAVAIHCSCSEDLSSDPGGVQCGWPGDRVRDLEHPVARDARARPLRLSDVLPRRAICLQYRLPERLPSIIAPAEANLSFGPIGLQRPRPRLDIEQELRELNSLCLLYTSDAADDLLC